MAYSDPALAVESPLDDKEIGDAEGLVHESGWNQTAADWRIFLDLGRVYAIRNSARRVVATAATLPHGDRFAWISMVLVAGEYRRQGLAKRLLRRCIDDLTARRLVPVLDATPAGRAVYAALGFEDSWSYQRLMLREGAHSDAVPPAVAGTIIRPISEAVWPALCAYDAAAFGADRGALLARLRGRLPSAEFYAERDGRVTGVLLGRDGRTASQLGPLIAEDDATARALLANALRAVPSPVYIDFADQKGALRSWLEQGGFVSQRPLTRMLYRRRESFDDTTRTYAVAGPEFG